MSTKAIDDLYGHFLALTDNELAASNLVLAQVTASKSLPDALLTAEQVAQMFGVDTRTIRRRVTDGTFPAPVKVGRCPRWRRSDLEGLW